MNNRDIKAMINSELAFINDWLKSKKLTRNINKCKYMTVNENLNWKIHTDKIVNKISKSIGLLNKLKHFLPLESNCDLSM